MIGIDVFAAVLVAGSPLNIGVIAFLYFRRRE
jgi:hypothetical protein